MRRVFPTLFLLVASVLLTSCAIRHNPLLSDFWNENKEIGEVYTNEFARLQDSTPFTIVIPKYLPHDIQQGHPTIFTRKQEGGYVSVSFQYIGSITADFSIYECYPPLAISDQETYTPYDVAGISVFEKVTKEQVIIPTASTLTISANDTNPTVELTSTTNCWVNNGVFFAVTGLGYDQATARMVVESMIR